MMYCPICGTQLFETNRLKQLCPNCGIIKEGEIEYEEDKNSTGGYIR